MLLGQFAEFPGHAVGFARGVGGGAADRFGEIGDESRGLGFSGHLEAQGRDDPLPRSLDRDGPVRNERAEQDDRLPGLGADDAHVVVGRAAHPAER